MLPNTSFPAWPIGGGLRPAGISPYGIATRFGQLVGKRAEAAAEHDADRGRAGVVLRMYVDGRCIDLQQHAGDAGRHEIRHRPRRDRLQPEPREVRFAARRERADAADLNRDGAEIRKPAQRIRRDRERPRIERVP